MTTHRYDAPFGSTQPLKPGERVLEKPAACQCFSHGDGTSAGCFSTGWKANTRGGVTAIVVPCSGVRGDHEDAREGESPIDAAQRRADAARARAGHAGAPEGALTKDTIPRR